MENKQCVLVVDDNELNRFVLNDILCDDFTVLEAVNGKEALSVIAKHRADLAVVLLDIVMPEMDGFGVLNAMNVTGDIEHIPVIMISAETADNSVERAYSLGATDYISKPFVPTIVKKRIINTIDLYNKQQSLTNLVIEQVAKQQTNLAKMIGVLSSIVETRNHESASHTLHIKIITRELFNNLLKKDNSYNLTKENIDLICNASSLHDIGKMRVPDAVLNKPGRFTPEEFDIMKKHTEYGAEMLKQYDDCTDDLLMRYSYDICYYHHERYDGRGYPKGLKGDEIPIWAQVVGVADVYDALTAERVYKPAYSHEKAIQMITAGECGCFNPMLMQCLLECQEDIRQRLSDQEKSHDEIVREIANEILQQHPIGLSQKTFNLYHLEQIKNDFYTDISDGVHFDYSFNSHELLIRKNSRLNCSEKIIKNPMQNKEVLDYAGEKTLMDFVLLARKATRENPYFTKNYTVALANGHSRKYRLDGDVLFEEGSKNCIGVIGKITPVEDL